MDFFNQKKKEIDLCEIDQLFKDEIKNSIAILEVAARLIIGYQEEVDVDFRLGELKKAYESLDYIILDLKKIWLVRNKSSRLNDSVENLEKIKKFIKMSIEYYQGGKNGTQN